MQDLDNELRLKECRKKRRAHIQEIVNGSMLTEQEKEWMEEDIQPPMIHCTYNGMNRYVERVAMPNLFDMCRKYHN